MPFEVTKVFENNVDFSSFKVNLLNHAEWPGL